jgi:hypothetical protein
MKLMGYLILIFLMFSKMIGIGFSIEWMQYLNRIIKIGPSPIIASAKTSKEIFTLKPEVSFNNEASIKLSNNLYWTGCSHKQIMFEFLYLSAIDFTNQEQLLLISRKLFCEPSCVGNYLAKEAKVDHVERFKFSFKSLSGEYQNEIESTCPKN